MYLIQVLGAAVLGAGLTTADFMVYTEPPIPTTAIPTFTNPSQARSWTQNVFFDALQGYAGWERSGGAAYQSSKTSAHSEISAFAASNANWSIPAAVTGTDDTTTFTSAPTWYPALPSGAREFKEKQVSAQFSAVRAEVSQRAETGGAGGAGATRTSQGGAVVRTPAAAAMGLGGMGMAVIAGIFL